MFKDFYGSKRVLVTGHTGFMGSWLCIWLTELGAAVTGYSLDPPSHPNNFEACGLAGHIDHRHGDVRDKHHLSAVFQEKKPQMVFHLAAQSLVRLSYEDPLGTFDTNAGGTANVLEAARFAPDVRVIVNVTSDKCYENREWVWGYRENDPLGGHDAYSASKACAEIVSSSYLKSFFTDAGVGAASVRVGNVIGGGDWGRDRLVPDCIRALSSGKTVRIRMPNAVRPWQHVLEPLSGYLWLGRRIWESPQQYSGPWNFGPGSGQGFTVGEVVETLIGLWGRGAWKEEAAPERYHEAGTLRLCCDKAHACLGWRDLLPTAEALAMTTDWYKTFYARPTAQNMIEVCRDQIRAYAEKAGRAGLPWAL
ncbi:MAG: CDP-glucose 4,6-dehydratase [Deltaproteobacteria bacterium]|nr:CDP-glucose 4,6-dehydratase [Deltaproteobacteria bacterium]